MKKRIVVALGGNALGKTLPEQYAAVKKTAAAVVDLIEQGHDVIVTHGNGPQVGMINNAMAALAREDPQQDNTPLSVCVAMSQAYIGYDLQNALREELTRRGIQKPVAAIVTQVRIDPNDPALDRFDKPIGRFYTKEEADVLVRQYGHVMRDDAGRGYRRFVPSPKPVEIIESGAIRDLVNAGHVAICCGGGGIPVIQNGNHLKGVSAVIDKDAASCLLAKNIGADMLIILTAVEHVFLHYRQPDECKLTDVTAAQMQKYIKENQFPAGSMLPKVQAASDFAASAPGRVALITLLQKAGDGVLGKTGTRITG